MNLIQMDPSFKILRKAYLILNDYIFTDYNQKEGEVEIRISITCTKLAKCTAAQQVIIYSALNPEFCFVKVEYNLLFPMKQ